MMWFLGTTLLEIDHLAAGISDALKFHRGTYYVILRVPHRWFSDFCSWPAAFCFFGGGHSLRQASVIEQRIGMYLSFLAIGITGYLVEGLRMVWQQPSGIAANCSPVGLWISHWFSA